MILKHLQERHLQLERYNNHIVVDKENNITTFLLWNLSGMMVGYQRYNPSLPKKTKYWSYITPGMNGVWGLETINYRKDLLIVIEGVFNACRFHNLELPAIAVLCHDPLHLKSWFKGLGRKIICVCDPDKPGQKLAKFGHEALFPSTDLDLMTDLQIKELICTN